MRIKFAIIFAVISLSATAFGQKNPAAVNETAKPASTPAAKLPSAKEIVDKYAKAVGGVDAVQRVKSRKMTGTLAMKPMNLTGSFEAYTAVPDKIYTKIGLNGIGDIINGFDGSKGWTVNPLQGSRDIEGDELAQLKLGADMMRDVTLDKLYPGLTVKGIEKVGDREVYVLAGSHGSLPEEKFYFDKENGMLLRSDTTTISPEGRILSTTYFEDYRDVDGIKVAYRNRIVSPMGEMTITLTDVKQNVPAADSLFAKPAAN